MIAKTRLRLVSLLSLLSGFFLVLLGYSRPAESQQNAAARAKKTNPAVELTPRALTYAPSGSPCPAIKLTPRALTVAPQDHQITPDSVLSVFKDAEEQERFVKSLGNCEASTDDLLLFKLKELQERLDRIEKSLN